MSKYDIDKYSLPDKYIAEAIKNLIEKCEVKK